MGFSVPYFLKTRRDYLREAQVEAYRGPPLRQATGFVDRRLPKDPEKLVNRDRPSPKISAAP